MTYYVTCITKKPTHEDPRHRITRLGTTTTRGLVIPSKVWDAKDVVQAIDSGHVLYGAATSLATSSRSSRPRISTAST